MATATVHNGKAIVAYVNGHAVDSEGVRIDGAPKAPKDTDPSLQPASAGTPEERMGLAIAKAIADPKGTLRASQPATVPKGEAPEAPVVEKTASQRAGELGAGGAEPETKELEEGELPKIADLKAHLAGMTTAKEVKALQRKDDRTGAQRLYEARLAELKGE